MTDGVALQLPEGHQHPTHKKRNDDLEGSEFDWFAVDRDGHVALFATAGYGPIPQAVLESVDEQRQVETYLSSIPATTQAIHIGGEGDLEDWFAVARRGLYAYDWQHWNGPYGMIASPETPLHISSVPGHLQVIIGKTRLESLSFGGSSNVELAEFFVC